MRAPVYAAFARVVGARLDEVELPLDEYPSFGSFFARRLRADARPLARGQDLLISPCDGTVAAIGVAERGNLIQAKGKPYELAKLLVDPDRAARLEGGAYLTIYLAPRDYHRVHSPADAELVGYDYVPGTLFPVNALFSKHIDNLLTANERIVLALDATMGAMAMVMVGAAGVGNVTLSHPCVEARELRRAGTLRRVRLCEPLPVELGQELGAFHLGSTVIMVFEPGQVDLAELAPGQPLCLGEPIGRIRRNARSGNGRNW